MKQWESTLEFWRSAGFPSSYFAKASEPCPSDFLSSNLNAEVGDHPCPKAIALAKMG